MKRVGLVAKLVSSWPGDLHLGVHLHRWPLRAEDCAAFQSLSPVSPAVLQLGAALPAFVPALDAAELVGPSPWPGRQLGQSRQWEMFPAGLLVWLGSKRAGGIACQQKGFGVGGLGAACLSWQQSGLCHSRLESCALTYSYWCKDELVMTSALGPLSMSLLERVLPCREELLHVRLSMRASKLILGAELSAPRVRNPPCSR